MKNIIQKVTIFMQGRYGFDTLNKFLLGFSLALWLIRWFLKLFMPFTQHARVILLLFVLAFTALFVFRFLSRNSVRRSAENRAFVTVYTPVKRWCQFTFKRFKDRKDFRYLKCPMCKAQLRVKNKKGTHTVRCPRCGSEFEKTIRF